MSIKILVATPDPAFGEWLQASLVENGGYDVHLVQTGAEVLRSAAGYPFAAAILDSDLPGEPFVPLARALLAQLPGLRLLVIPPENNPHHPNLGGLVPQGYLFRPFYLPDLLGTLQSLLASSAARSNGIEAPPVEVDSPAVDWLEEPGQAARELARLLLETEAQTAFIAAEGRLWASAGHINQAAAAEAAALLENCWQEDHAVDLARYVRLEASGSEHLLCAVPLLGELALALLFDPGAPLTRAHRETIRLARALTATVSGRPLPEPPTIQTPSEPAVEPDLAGMADAVALSGWLPEMPEIPAQTGEAAFSFADEPAAPTPPPETWSSADLRAALAGPELAPETAGEAAQEPPEDDFDEEPVIDLAAVLAGMPSPDPGGEPVFPADAWVPEQEIPPAPFTAPENADEAVDARLDALSNAVPVTAQEPPAPQPVEEAPAPVAPPGPPTDEIPGWIFEPPLSETTPLQVETTPLQVDPGKTGPLTPRIQREPPPDRSEDALLPPARRKSSRAMPVTAGAAYTCILIPERPDHFLTGDLADRLEVWVPQLCLAFGWHLSGLVVRPGYLQWTVDLDPAVSPGNVVRVIRQRTSERVFSQFPALRYGLSRNDFWAPGYLAVRGPRPPYDSLLEGFIRQTRARQRY